MNRSYKNRTRELRPQNLFLRKPEDNPMLAAVAIALAVEAKAEPVSNVPAPKSQPVETAERDRVDLPPRSPELRKRPRQLRAVFTVVYDGTMKFGN